MTLKEFAQVFDDSTIFYIEDNNNRLVDKKTCKFIEKSNYAEKNVIFTKLFELGIRIWIEE